jgi:16S rRNA (cytosine967-C5)-methyltransferase
MAAGTPPGSETGFVKPGVAARRAAAGVVGRVVRQGAWTRQALDAAISRQPPEDRAQIEALTFGTIRRLARIDRGLHTAARGAVDDEVADQLRVGIFELWWGRAPVPVAVDVAVEAVRAIKPRAAAFANAVLRKLALGEPPLPPGAEGDALEMALPQWLWEDLAGSWGREEAAAFATTSLDDARIGVRRRPGAPLPAGEPVPGIPEAFFVNAGDVGVHQVEDPSSVAAVEALEVEPGHRVLDLAAAPGGKTMHLADLAGEEGLVLAMEIHARRARTAARRVPAARWVVADATRPPLRTRFDRILLDAPCSGFGTLRRRPEIRHRVDRRAVERLAGLQRRILEQALPLLVPGGRLVYSVCTVTPAETVAVVAGGGARPAAGLPGRPWGDGWLLGPHLTATDGMFIAVFDS